MDVLYKNTLIKIKKSFGRYISLFMIVMIGVGFFAGIQATVPDVIAVADDYYSNNNLMDFKIVSTLGLTDDDVNELKALNNVKSVIPSYSLDVLNQEKAIRIHAIENTVNTVKLIDGRMPQSDKECIADSKTYKIGNQIKITSDVSEKLQNDEFTVVGTAESVLYIADDYGNTTVGDGKLSSFIFIDSKNFILDAYTEIYLIAKDTKNTTAYSKDYENEALKLNDELVKIKTSRENARYQEINAKANEEISESETKLHDEKSKGEKELAEAKVELDNNAQKLKDGKAELVRNERDLQENINKQNREFEASKAEIAAGWKEINATLAQNSIKKEELNTKINELNSSIEAMKGQLNQLPADSQEHSQLSAALKQYTELYNGLVKLKESIDTLTSNEEELNKGIGIFNSEMAKAKTKIENGKIELAENEKKLNDGYDEYSKNLEKFNSEIADAQTKLNDAKMDLSDMEKPQWIIFDRDGALGYSDLQTGLDIITSIAAVFPIFFILIGVLMTSNSMARMIAEERSELGTLTSLGYKDNSIITTYLLYVLSASILGAVTGFFVGCSIIPPLIYLNFQFILPPLIIKFDMMLFLIILVVTLIIMTLVTVVACFRELKQKPAALMRPVPPQKGKTILLEKITPIWKHLSFTWKVTMRNMFRYKKRALMTIIGVAGCTSLLLVGFGLRDSMNGVAEKQYGDIFRYDNMIILKDETKNIEGELERLLTTEKVQEPLLLKQAAFKCETEAKALELFLIVPENEDLFNKYYNLKGKATGSDLSLSSSGVIITQKLAEEFEVYKGDTITVKDADNNVYQLTVSDVAENYTSNYIYMNNAQYSKVFGKAASYNVVLSDYSSDKKALAKNLIDSGLVLNVVFTSDVVQKVLDSNESLNSIIVLIVAVASLLAIIVLYNLTSINISERTREIATLKVLGFTDGETNGYIYREAFILTLISIGMGLIMGIFLHRFVIDVIDGYTTFFKHIKWSSFVLAGLLTMIFTVFMQIVTYYKLRTIDMIESLKSVE